MSVKKTARKQAIKHVDAVTEEANVLKLPVGSWIATLRQALRLPVTSLAARLGISRAAIYQAERNEAIGAITISQMRKIAAAMNADFVYAIVPKESVASTLKAQALLKANALVRRAGSHMSLECQGLSSDQLEERVQDLAEELLRNPPRDFWEVK